MKSPTVKPRDLIAGLQKGLALMLLFSEQTPRITVPMAAKRLGLTSSATRRFLLTLVHEGFAETDGRFYVLTPRTLRLGQAYVDSAHLPRVLRQAVEHVSNLIGEHVSVGVRDEEDVIHIVRSRYSHVSSTSIRLGSRVPVYCTAAGRVWLASQSEAEIDRFLSSIQLRALTPYTKTDPDEIKAELQLIAERGYAWVDQEFEVGMRVLGVPLYGNSGRLMGTMSVTTHASRMTVEDMRSRFLTTLYEAQSMLRPLLEQ